MLGYYGIRSFKISTIFYVLDFCRQISDASGIISVDHSHLIPNFLVRETNVLSLNRLMQSGGCVDQTIKVPNNKVVIKCYICSMVGVLYTSLMILLTKCHA